MRGSMNIPRDLQALDRRDWQLWGISFVIIATLAGFGLGAVWYMVLGGAWLNAIGKTKEQLAKDEGPAKALPFIIALVALFIMAIILVTQFNSFYQALLILSAVIFSTVGVFLGLLFTGEPFGIVMSGVGVIALAGIVTRNSVILVDFVHLALRRGQDDPDSGGDRPPRRAGCCRALLDFPYHAASEASRD